MADQQKAEAQSFKDAICEEVADFYSRKSRDAIGRAAGRYLQSVRLTPTELLHSTRHQRNFSDAGQTLMQAVQKTAIAQVKGTQMPVSERVRRLYELTDALHKDCLEKLEKDPPGKLEKENLPDLMATRRGEKPAEHAFRVRAALTETLDGVNDWVKKFETLYDLGHTITGIEAFGHFDPLIAEILRAPDAAKNIFGQMRSTGEEVERLMALHRGEIEPFEAPDKPANAKKFYTLAKSGYIPETRDVILRLLVRALESSGKLTNGNLGAELEQVRSIYAKMNTPNGFLGGDECQTALEKREASLLSDETIDLVVGGRIEVPDKILMALHLRKGAISEKGSDYLSRYVTSIMGQPDFERAVRNSEGSLEDKLALLAKIFKETKANRFPPRIEDRICGAVEELQATILEQSGFYKKLDARSNTTAAKALKVIDLLADGILVGSGNVKVARKSAHDFMKKPDFLESYLSDAADAQSKKSMLRDLEQRLKAAGLA
ncbi:hypothetical protein [Nisaea sp.]|uniref:hypothetical protein n=1 Tax=Nisaea sp. TaxID=2024842 RepID=UPI003B52F7ED